MKKNDQAELTFFRGEVFFILGDDNIEDTLWRGQRELEATLRTYMMLLERHIGRPELQHNDSLMREWIKLIGIVLDIQEENYRHNMALENAPKSRRYAWEN